MKNITLPNLIAHRGAGLMAPENTLVAFRNGYLHGFSMFECDVRLSKDKELFLLHDDDLHRTTDSKGLASDLTWSELSRLDAGSWCSSVFTAEPLARLEGILNFISANNLSLNIELKPTLGQEYDTGYLCAKLVSEFCVENENIQVVLSSFSVESLQGAVDGYSNIPRALLLNEWRDDSLYVLEQLGCQGVVINHLSLTVQLICQIKKKQFFVMAYTANEIQTIQSLIDMGVSAVITDNMNAALTINIFDTV